MKALLMHRDRDFDPELLLVRRERELRHTRDSDANLNLQQLLPWNEGALRQDLGLDVIFSAMAANDKFLFEVAQVAILNSLTDLKAIQYRQQILSDSLTNESVVREIYALAWEAIEGERKNYWGSFNRNPTLTLHRGVEVLKNFVRILKRLRALADRNRSRFESSGFSRFFTVLQTELSEEYFLEVDEHLRRLHFGRGTLLSAQLGNGNKGENYVLRKLPDDKRWWLTRLFERPPGYSYQLHPRDEAGAHALSNLSDRAVNLVANALAQSTDHILSFFQMLRTELAFYLGCLNLHAKLAEIGEPICFPSVAPAGHRKMAFVGLYDPTLALSMNKRVVGNNLRADDKNIIVITGANTGGKSTFLRSVGVAQIMMQTGMFAPAQKFQSEICASVITHYRRKEDTTMQSGKWDEELGRMSDIVSKLRANSMILFNESFASTNEREGSEIAGQIVRALLDRRIKILFVTHLYHFASSFFNLNSRNAVFMRAERRSDGTRPFALIEAEPLQTSHGNDLYKAIFSDRAAGAALQ